MSRIDGFLSREVIVALKGEEIARYPLHIIKPLVAETSLLNKFPVSLQKIEIEGYEITPFSSEIPFICYIDSPLYVNEDRAGRLVLSI